MAVSFIGSLDLLKNYSNTNMRRRVYLHLTTQRALQKDEEITIRYTPVFEVGTLKVTLCYVLGQAKFILVKCLKLQRETWARR